MTQIAIHPGELLAEELEALDMSTAELARKMDVPTNRVTQILNATRAITGDTALRLAHFFGTSAQIWLNLQCLYDLRVAQEKVGRSIKGLPKLKRRTRPCMKDNATNSGNDELRSENNKKVFCIGLDVHQATISVAVLDSTGKSVMEAILETKAETILAFISGVTSGFRNREDRRSRCGSGFHKSEQYHQKAEPAFGRHIAVIDPKPIISVSHGGERFIRIRFGCGRMHAD